MQHNNQQGHAPCMRSFIDVLHEAPVLHEALPAEARKALSATCRSLQSSFCAQVRVIIMSDADDASKLCCATWPQLLMVVVGRFLFYTCGSTLASILSAQWEVLMGMTLFSTSWTRKTAVLIRSRQQAHAALVDLPRQHCAALSDFADRYRDAAREIALWGPLVGCRVVQALSHDVWPIVSRLTLWDSPYFDAETMSYLNTCLPNLQTIDIKDCSAAALELFRSGTAWPQITRVILAHNQLGASGVALMPHIRWTHLVFLEMSYNMIGDSGMQHLVACSWPCLKGLYLESTGLGRPALRCLAEGQWPKLRLLDLTDNDIDAIGISYLVQGSWPLLVYLCLSQHGLDEEACSLLGIAYPATPNTNEKTVVSCKSGLVQFHS